MLILPAIRAFFRSLGRLHTYNPLHNPELWFGLLWGLPIPVFSVTIDIALLGSHGRSLATIISQHPWHLAFFAHPLVFAIVFGAMGTTRRELERRNTELIARLEREATTDPLTGAWNRRFILEELERAVSRAARSGEPLSVLMFDMDDFKRVNDTQGHLAGDRLLRDVAQALRDSLRKGDVLGRYGGDEFLLVAPGDRESALSVADRARAEVRERTGHSVTAGLASMPADGATVTELVAASDRAMAAAKREGRTRRYAGPPTF
jgi:diguanylate cyclase (GGDEF)-like protein